MTAPFSTVSLSDGEARARFRAEVIEGLRRKPKELPCKYFYDQVGSRLFEQICELPEYYLTRAELQILQQHAGEMATRLGPRCLVIELGSGSAIKTQLLLDALDRPAGCVLVDVSLEHLQAAAAKLARRYPALAVVPLHADFTGELTLPPLLRPIDRRVVYFPGSTIGNFGPAETDQLLRRIARLCGPGGLLLLGADLKKELFVLESAYNDAAGVTRDFNLNLLARINRELQGDFDLSAFRHLAFYNAEEGCIEMHLISQRRQTACVGEARFVFEKGESIRTERSYKYDLDEFSRQADQAGFSVDAVWRDERGWFANLLLRVKP